MRELPFREAAAAFVEEANGELSPARVVSGDRGKTDSLCRPYARHEEIRPLRRSGQVTASAPRQAGFEQVGCVTGLLVLAFEGGRESLPFAGALGTDARRAQLEL